MRRIEMYILQGRGGMIINMMNSKNAQKRIRMLKKINCRPIMISSNGKGDVGYLRRGNIWGQSNPVSYQKHLRLSTQK